MSASAWLGVARGREIHFSPRWDEDDASIAFDAASGDYWVLDGLGRAIVDRLVMRGAVPAHELLGELGRDVDAEQFDAAIRGLTDTRLLQRRPATSADGPG